MISRRYLGVAAVLALLAGPAAHADDEKKADKKPDAKAEAKADAGVAVLAHIRIEGDLDETPITADPLFGGISENFKSKLDRIKKAKNDPKIQGLYLQIDSLPIGWGKVDELRRAIADFRSAGKKAYAFLEDADTKEYLVALACDTVCLPESGTLMLVGMRAEVMFYADLFQKVGIKADFLQMGDYKGAAEPFTRSSMSKELRGQFEKVYDDYFEKSLVQTIIKSRPGKKWTAEQVKDMIDNGPYTAKKAAELGLIDQVAYPDAFDESLKKALDVETVKVTREYGKARPEDLDLSNPFALMMKMLSPPKPAASKKPKVAVIYAVGPIDTGKGGGGLFDSSSVGSETMVKAIQEAEKDATVKAIVLRVDSPGGSALASDLIWHELGRSKKPVIASMGDVAASGGYYISMGAQKIFAEPGTLTGSIGVVGGKLVTKELFDWAGLKIDVIARGKNSGVLSTQTMFNEGEKRAMTVLMQDVYDQFLDKALAGRKKAGVSMDKPKLLSLAGGRIWTGRQAKENGLIDELGTLDDAIAYAKEQAKLPKDQDVELLILPKPRTFLDQLMEGKLETSMKQSAVSPFPLASELPELAAALKQVGAFMKARNDRVWLMAPYVFEVK